MFRDFKEKQENLFDKIDIILRSRKKIRSRLKNAKNPDEAELYRRTIRKKYFGKVDEKRLGGMQLQAKVMPWFALVAAIVFLWGLLVSHHLVATVGGLVALFYGGFSYVSAASRLWKLALEADREAAQAVVASRPSEEKRAASRLRQVPHKVSRQDLMAQALHQAQQPQQTQPSGQTGQVQSSGQTGQSQQA